jgi:hypothetical protein
MRLMLLRTFAIAALLSVLAVASTTILFTRTLPANEGVQSAPPGYTGSSRPEPAEGLKVLLVLVNEPAFGLPILLPQLGASFAFLWAAAILGSGRWARGSVAYNSFKPNPLRGSA